METTFAQGDNLFRRIEVLPAGLTPVAPENGVVVVGHSETGHHHVMDASNVEMFRDPRNLMLAYVVVTGVTLLRHLRPHDTHAPIAVEAGIYEVRRQREYVPGGWAMVAD